MSQQGVGAALPLGLELAEDLERYFRDEPIRARPVRAPERLWRWCRRNPLVVTTTTLAVAALIVTIVVTIVASVRERAREAEVAQQKLESEQREREKDRERLRQSLLEKARAERLAGKRGDALKSLREAAQIKADDTLRLEALQAITQSEFALVGERRAEADLQEGESVTGTRQGFFSSQQFNIHPRHLDAFQVRVNPLGKPMLPLPVPAGMKVIGASPTARMAALWGLLEVDTGRDVQTWNLDKGNWIAFALNPDGTRVVSGGGDKRIRLWDVATGKELAHWQGHDGEVTVLLFSRDGNILYSGSQDGSLKLWNLAFIRKELKVLGLDW